MPAGRAGRVGTVRKDVSGFLIVMVTAVPGPWGWASSRVPESRTALSGVSLIPFSVRPTFDPGAR